MKKIVMLMPCLMLENNREVNNNALDYALEHCDMDLIVINDQEFEESDYRTDSRILYIGKHKERQGFVKGRNQLLEWFYNSEYDWAVWLDANAKITPTTINDFRTMVDAVKNNKVEVDVVLSTLGIMVSDIRIAARKAVDHLQNIKLTKARGTENAWMHSMFMKNFQKEYRMKVFIDEKCDPRTGLSEDAYFVQLCKSLFSVRICPTIIVTKPTNKTSTWVADKAGYTYPPVDWEGIANMVKKSGYEPIEEKKLKNTFVLPRVEYGIENVTIYKEKRKIKERGGLI